MPTSRRVRSAFATVLTVALAVGGFCLWRTVGANGKPVSSPRAGSPAVPEAVARKAAARERVANAMESLPLSFEENRGQVGEQVKFISRGSGYALFLTETETVLSLYTARRLKNGRPESGDRGAPAVMRMSLVDANAQPAVAGVELLPGKANYIRGGGTVSDIPTYRKVRCAAVYPGIDVVYYGNQRQLEFDFVVAPGGDHRAIKLAVQGAADADIDEQGDLVLTFAGGQVRQHKPVVYQNIGGARKTVEGAYVLSPATTPGTRLVGFEVAAYDENEPLVIDPVLVYSTFFGDRPNVPTVAESDHSGDEGGNAIAVDSLGNAYVAGFTNSVEFPTVAPVQTRLDPLNHPTSPPHFQPMDYDAFLTKFNADASTILYSTYIGGSSGDDLATAVAVAANFSPYIAGTTTSSNFPIKKALHTYAGGVDTFLIKLTSSGAGVDFSTYLGGSGDDVCADMTLDTAGNVYLAGSTTSRNLATANPVQAQNASTAATGSDAFVAKFTPDGSVLIYSTYLGGEGDDAAMGVATDASGNCYVVGFSGSANFPSAAPLQVQNAGGNDAFVAKLNPSGTLLVFSTYIGGSDEDQANGVAVDATGNVYVAGYTRSLDFPTVSPTILPVQTTNHGQKDAFVSKLNNLGAALTFSTYLGGTGDDEARRVAVDARGAIYIVGKTDSQDFPIAPAANTLQSGLAGGTDGFISKFNPTGTPLVYSTYFGAGTHKVRTNNQIYNTGIAPDAQFIDAFFLPKDIPTNDEVRGLAVDNNGNAYVTGWTYGSFYHTFGAYSSITPYEPAPGEDYPAPYTQYTYDVNGNLIPLPSEAGTDTDERDVYISKIGDSSPVINSPLTASGTFAALFTYQITATNTPTSFNAAGLPAGLGVDTAFGKISGTPTATGTSHVVLTASNASGTGSQILILNISSGPPTINSPLSATATVGEVFSYTITATNDPGAFTAVGLPPGLAVDQLTGLISGAPLSEGPFNVEITASNSGGTDTETLIITVMPAVPVVTSPARAQGLVNMPFRYTIQADNNPSSFDASTNGTTTTAGTITTAVSSTSFVASTLMNLGPFFGPTIPNYNVTIAFGPAVPAVDCIRSVTAFDPLTGTVTVDSPFTLSDGTAVAPTAGTNFRIQALPPGLSLNTSTGIIAGTPLSLGSFNIGLSASNSSGTGTLNLSLEIILPAFPVINSPDAAIAVVGQPFSYSITATNSPLTYSINVDGTVDAVPVPALTTFRSSSLINMGPFLGFPLTMTSPGPNVNATRTIVAFDGATGDVTLDANLNAVPIDGDSFYIKVLPMDAALGGSLHFLSGLTLNDSTGTLSGTPAVNSAGQTYSLTLCATNAAGTGTKLLQLPIYKPQPPYISSPASATGRVATSFEYDIAANNPTTLAQGTITGIGVPDLQFTSLDLVNGGPFAVRTIAMTSGAALNLSQTISTFVSDTGTVTLAGALTGIAPGDTFIIVVPPVTNAPATAVNGFVTANAAGFQFDSAHLRGILPGTTLVGKTINVFTPGLAQNRQIETFDPVNGRITILAAGAAFAPVPPVGTGFSILIDPYNAIRSLPDPPLPLTPSGLLTVNNTTGAITGTPAATDAGPWNLTVFASNTGGTSSMPVSLQIQPLGVPVITSPGSTQGISGIPFSYLITATNAPTLFGAAGLPAGLTVNTGTVTSGTAPTIIVASGLAGAAVAHVQGQKLTVTSGPATGNIRVITNFDPATGTITVSSAFIDGGGAPVTPAAGNSFVIPGLIYGVPAAPGIANVTLTATNAIGSGTKPLTLTIVTPVMPSITSPLHVTGIDGAAFSYTITATGTTPIVFGAAPLPPGLVLNGTVISGRPSQPGTFNVTLTASNAATAPAQPGVPPDTEILVIDISPTTAAITNQILTINGIVGTPLSYTITATGSTPVTIGAAPLPPGLSLSGTTVVDGITSAVISGTPGPAARGTTPVTLTASNAYNPVGQPYTTTLTIIIAAEMPVITSPLTASGVDGQPFSYTITATGTAPMTFTAKILPNGLTFAGTTIFGTPTSLAIGTTPVTLTATNSSGTDTKTLVLTIAPAPPVITSALAVTTLDGSPFTYTIAATGTAPLRFDAQPMPPGLTHLPDDPKITGTPTAVGVYTINLTATNDVSSDTKQLVLTVNAAPPVITSPLAASGPDGSPFTYTITASGTAPITFSAAGLPQGLSLTDAVISGTPTVAGTTNVTLYASNSAGTNTKTLVIQIFPVKPTITNTVLLARATPNVAFSYTITATGTQPITYWIGNAPPGLVVDAGTGVISGVPTTVNTYNVTLRASNALGKDEEILVIEVVLAPPVITSPLTAMGSDGVPFTYTITADGSVPITFAAAPLPAGLSLDTATGIISGTPTAPGTTNVTISATNGVAPGIDTKTLVITINPTPPAITSATSGTAYTGEAFSYAITATGTAPLTYAAAGLPPGLSLTGSAISGTPTTAGSYDVRITVSNQYGSDTKTLKLDVFARPAINSPLNVTGIINQTFTYNLTATNSPTLFSLDVATLPPGLSFDPNTGGISGTPTTAGTYPITVTAKNAGGSGPPATLTIVIVPPVPIITSLLTVPGTIGKPFTYTIVVTGVTPMGISTSELPPGLTLSPVSYSSGISTAVISGTPTAAGDYIITITAKNAAGTDTETLVIIISDDSDGDGFPDALEIALGSDPNNPNSTPFDGKSITDKDKDVINITAMMIKLDFAKPNKDAISLRGTVAVPNDFDPTGQEVALVISGIVKKFTVGPRGAGTAVPASKNDKLTLKLSKTALPGAKTVVGTIKAKFVNGSFQTPLYNDHLRNETVTQESVSVQIYFVLDKTKLYEARKLLSYTARLKKSGTAKHVNALQQ